MVLLMSYLFSRKIVLFLFSPHSSSNSNLSKDVTIEYSAQATTTSKTHTITEDGLYTIIVINSATWKLAIKH